MPDVSHQATDVNTRFEAVPQTLLANGYRPVPIEPGTKRPIGKNWVEVARKATHASLAAWSTPSVGILCEGVVAVDIDLTDPDIADQAATLAMIYLGDTPLIRYGARPKRVMVYRSLDAQQPWMHTPKSAIGHIEVRARGQQFVGFGRHPDGHEYEWQGATPLNTPADSLPAVDAAALREFLAAAAELLGGEFALHPVSVAQSPKHAADLAPPDAATVVALLDRLPNTADTDRETYVAVMLAAAGCITGLDAVGRLGDFDAEAIGDAAVRWASRWPDSPGEDVEAARWRDDFSTRDRPLAGWLHLQQHAARWIPGFGLESATEDFADAAIPGSQARPLIRISADNLTSQINQAEAALLSADLGLYRRGGAVVRVGEVAERQRDGTTRQVLRCIEVDETHLRELIGRRADFERFDARAKEYVRTRCPADVPRGYLARQSLEWNLPPLTGIITAPTMRPDGSLLQQPGYDTATGLLFDPRAECFPTVAENPSHDDARKALALLRGLIDEFPFMEDASRSVALSAIVTAPVRRSLDAAPMHAFTAPAPGTGKSYLLDLVCHIAFGESASGCGYSADEAENAKQIDAALVAGAPVLVLDNVDVELRGARLNQVLTQGRVTIRILGLTKNVEAACDLFVLANGNNLVIAADMTRRTVLCRMDAEAERPELREFRQNPLAMVRTDRGLYVAAALTVLRAYHIAGRPNRPKPFASFDAWSALIRGALIWLGEADPAATTESVREGDPRRADALAVIGQWDAVIGGKPVTAREAIDVANGVAEFRDALLAVAEVGGRIDSRRLGTWLRDNRGKLVEGKRIMQSGTRGGSTTWRLDGGRVISAVTVDLAAARAERATRDFLPDGAPAGDMTDTMDVSAPYAGNLSVTES